MDCDEDCAFTDNGICDEPLRCLPGTDTADCDVNRTATSCSCEVR